MPDFSNPYSSTKDFRRKLGYYLLGIAIGLCMLGLFQKLRTRELTERQRKASEEAPLFPPAPEPQNSPAPSPAR